MNKLSLTILTLAIATLPALDAAAKERVKHGDYKRGNGQQGTYERRVNKERGQRSSSTEWTNAQGGQGSAHHERTWDKASGTGSSSSAVTRPNGSTATFDKSTQKTEDGHSTQGQGTNFRGQDVTMDRAVTNNGDGTRDVNATYTNQETGKSMTVDKTISNTENGTASSGTYSTGAGKTGTVSGSTNHEGGVSTRNTTFTDDATGAVRSQDVEVDRTGPGTTRSATVTNQQGETKTRQLSTAPTP